MAKNRYAKDYRLVETWDERGKVKTTYEYIGSPFRFSCTDETVEKEKKKVVVFMVTGWICYVAALLFRSQAMHALYVALPFAFTGIPLFIYTDIVFSFRKMQEPLEHRHADRMNNRYPPVTLLLTVFSLYALAGEAVNLAMKRDLFPGDMVFIAGAFGLFWIGMLAFRSKKNVEITEVRTGSQKQSG